MDIYKAITPHQSQEILDVTRQFIYAIPEQACWTDDYVEYLKLSEEDASFKIKLGDRIQLVKLVRKDENIFS